MERSTKILLGVTIFFTIIGIVFVILGPVIGYVVAPEMIKDEITKSVELKKGTDQFKRFEKLPLPFSFRVYVFDIQNAANLVSSSASITPDKKVPKVIEKGPYVYIEHREKTISEMKDGTITYKEVQTFEFDKKASGELSDQDFVTVLHPAINAATQLVEKMGLINMYEKYYNDIFNNPKNPIAPFIKITVNDYLFGKGIEICKGTRNLICGFLIIMAKGNLKNLRIEKDDKDDEYLVFTFFGHKNNHDDGEYNVNDGMGGIENVGWINTWQKNEYLQNMWAGAESTCNKVKGRDSVIYAPFIEKSTVLTIFNTDICRTVDLIYQEDSKYREADTQKFVMKRDTLDAPNGRGGTDCYCLKASPGLGVLECLKDGLMELNNCYGAPILLSWPHFLWADNTYKNIIPGMNPSEEKHVTYVELEPTTGTPVKGYRRVQFNMFVNKGAITPMQNLENTLLPILWVEEAVEINDDLYNMLKNQYIDKVVLIPGITWGIFGAGIALIVICIGVFIYMKFNGKFNKVNQPQTQDQSEVEN